MQALPVFTFANQAGLDMLETTLVSLQDISLEKIFDEEGRKTLFTEFPQVMQQVWYTFFEMNVIKKHKELWAWQITIESIKFLKIQKDSNVKYMIDSFVLSVRVVQGFMCLQGGICLSSMGRPVSYERAVAWKVVNDEENAHCICFMFINWSFVWKFRREYRV